MTTPHWPMARRVQNLKGSAIREILKLTERPGVLSMAGGLPSPQSFPVEALERASEQVWRHEGAQALQYASSEGLPRLREWLADRLQTRHGWAVQADQILITSGSQQGLDLLGKVLVDPDSEVLVEQPSYVGALQALSPYGARWRGWEADAQGPVPEGLRPEVRLAYLVPTFQNPSGHAIALARRQALVAQAREVAVPLIEDDPYGELWFDEPPPAPLAALAPDQVVYLGSLSKILAPGLRLGYIVCPRAQMASLGARLLQAKQACDLHTSSFSQRLVMRLIDDGFQLDQHVQRVRTRYRAQRDAMAQALTRHLPAGYSWGIPQGGMFFWVTGPRGLDTSALLPQAIGQGVAYVPGAAFHHQGGVGHCLRLSFVTLDEEQIEEGVSRLGRCLSQVIDGAGTLGACH